jgi:hypothetical protein
MEEGFDLIGAVISGILQGLVDFIVSLILGFLPIGE